MKQWDARLLFPRQKSKKTRPGVLESRLTLKAQNPSCFILIDLPLLKGMHMAYKRLRGIPGKVYVPDDLPAEQKHACKDCFNCQWCSDNRCECCHREGAHKKKKA